MAWHCVWSGWIDLHVQCGSSGHPGGARDGGLWVGGRRGRLGVALRGGHCQLLGPWAMVGGGGGGRARGGEVGGGIAEARLTLDDFVRVAEHVGARRAEV